MFIDINVVEVSKAREECVTLNTNHIVYIRDKDITLYGSTKKTHLEEIGLITGDKLYVNYNEGSKLRNAIL